MDKFTHSNKNLDKYRRYSKNRSFSLLEFETNEKYYIEPHWHNHIEILYVVKGNVTIQQELFFFNLTTDHIIYVASNCMHGLTLEKDTKIVVLQISTVWLYEVIPTFLSYDIFLCSSTIVSSQKQSSYERFTRLFLSLRDIFVSSKPEKDIGIHGYIFLLLYLMIDEFQIDCGLYEENKFKYQNRIKKISDFINMHYLENIKLENLAKELEVSSAYLSKLFKNYYQMSFKDYLTQIRLEHAIYEMVTTNHTLLEISENSGFTSQHAFIYAFKHFYQMTPSQYKETIKT